MVEQHLLGVNVSSRYLVMLEACLKCIILEQRVSVILQLLHAMPTIPSTPPAFI